jgi:hypothetical protein
MTPLLLQAVVFEQLGLVIKWLAGLGGFLVGGFLVGLFVQLLVAVAWRQKIPPLALALIRVLGGITIGWLAMLLVGTGNGTGNGFGFGGQGSESGNGPGSGSGKEQVASKDKDHSSTSNGSTETVPLRPSDTLEVEVLGIHAVKALVGKASYDSGKWYRVHTPEGTKLMTLEEVKKFIAPDEETTHYRRLVLVIYGDSPNRDKAQVTDLQNWANSFLLKDGKGKINVELVEKDEDAPVGTEGR